jgi:hypothetical protein
MLDPSRYSVAIRIAALYAPEVLLRSGGGFSSHDEGQRMTHTDEPMAIIAGASSSGVGASAGGDDE